MPTTPPVPDAPQEAAFSLDLLGKNVKPNGFPLTALEKAVRDAAQAALDSEGTPYTLAMGELAMALAENVSKGNIKGRAVANEAQTLKEVLTVMQGEHVAEAEEAVAGPLLSLVDRLGSKPQPGVSARSVAG